ncbi:6-pyruvoyl tetrahydropterin synthase family protein [Aeoliella sp. ICT_H6.2]|uniref:6-carboxy-5,6,7,8-tetrahydropterin synthase n=1 Tax=Aeoliella straminimaris TaxID=2954799 RepID=A0A9X2FIF0_9BACT|nr:6-pyruvoyl tetrahydropterin synthase family protein [Aeoliella straminimaris]MCO6045886.1 6-pyruvoyl tetrahydropterin synthase family protein [Aeoliella straminimaris]
MNNHYHVRLDKNEFTFCAAHFITYAGNICEPLHGHNYRVSAEIAGPLDENQYVVDFIAARDALLAITRKLDHRVLLPTSHPTIQVTQVGDEVTARFEERRWVFPASDCVLLPVSNTTAELLAHHIGEQLLAALAEHGFTPTSLEIAVDECQGQQGVCRWGN